MSRALVHQSWAPTPERRVAAPEMLRTAVVRPLSAWEMTPQRHDHCACGGGCPRCRGPGRWQARLAVNQPGDLWEQEADRIADAVVQTTASLPEATPAAVPGWTDAVLQRQQTTAGAEGQSNAGRSAPEAPTGLPLAGVETVGAGADAVAQQVLHASGTPLDSATRTFMERRFGYDFQQVRVHTDAAAQELARLTHAQALTWGPHIIFGAGQYAPTTSEGQHLLAHELVHTIQQASGITLRTPSPMVLQRQPQPGSPSEPPITAQTIFPFPPQSQIALNQILNEELFSQLAAVQPRVAATLQALNTRRATVQISTPEHFEAVLNEAISLPASGGVGQPAETFRNVTIRLRRNAAGRFDFQVVGQVDAGGTLVDLLPLPSDLTAVRQGNRIVLSAGAGAAAVPHLGLRPGAGGALNLSFFTAPFLHAVPAWARGMIPESIEVLSLSELPPASAGTAAVEQAASEAAARAQSQRRVRRQELSLGLGAQLGGEARLVLGTAWQYTFTLSETAGILFQVPLRVQLQYAPPDSVLAAIASGIGISLPLKVPVNLRALAGVAAGAVPGPERAISPRLPALGLTIGGGGGVELGSWRINLDYEHLFNFVEASPNIDTFLLSVGRTF